MISSEFSSFFQNFWVDVDNLPKDFNYSTLVLGDNVRTFPFQVARILTPPRGPTLSQDGLVWVIVPYIVEDDIRQLASMVTDQPLPSRSFDMRTGELVGHTVDTLLVNPEWFVNSVLLACYYYLSNGQNEVAYKMMKYINEILPYVDTSCTWSITPNDKGQPLAYIGNITNHQQLLDPYNHQDKIFLDAIPPHVKLS